MPCVLCDALVNQTSRIVYRDDFVFVLLNFEPLKEGHAMVLPVRHAEDLKDLTSEEAQAFLQAIDQCMVAVTEAFEDAPICMVHGWKFRTQRHLHAHVLPSKQSIRKLYVAAEGVSVRARVEDEALMRVAERLRPFFRS